MAAIIDPIAVMNSPIAPTGMTFYVFDHVSEWKNDWLYCNYHQGQLRRVRLAPGNRDRVVFEEVVKNDCDLNVAMVPDGALYYSNPKSIYRIHSAGATNLLPVVTTATAQQLSPPASDSAVTPRPTPAPTEEALPAGRRPEDRDINVSLTEWKLQPSRTKVPAGQILFLAENTGTTQHAPRVVGQGIDVSTDSFGPGDSRAMTLLLPPGEYQLVCPVLGHEQLGMTALLTVVGS